MRDMTDDEYDAEINEVATEVASLCAAECRSRGLDPRDTAVVLLAAMGSLSGLLSKHGVTAEHAWAQCTSEDCRGLFVDAFKAQERRRS